MKLLLIKPSIGASTLGRYRLNDGPMEPLQFGVIAALTPPDFQVALLDDRVEPIPPDCAAELVAITVDTYTARRAYQIADSFRARGIPVVLGGLHVSLLPDEAQPHADAVVVGDAEGAWPKVIEEFRAGRLAPRYGSTFGTPQAGVLPRRDLFRGKGYLPISLVQFSRGCSLACNYCSVASYFNRQHHCRDPGEVAEEIRKAGSKAVLFVDDNIVLDRYRAKELFRALKPLHIRWVSQASVDMVEDDELMGLMAQSGCMGQLIGFESIDPDALEWMNKKTNTRRFDRYEKALASLRRFGLQTWASFILGNDHDTEETIRQTVSFATRSKFTLGFFHLLSPYPGTPLYELLRRENRLLFDGRWWDHPDFTYNTAAFVPRNLTPARLSELTVWANREFYSASSILHRVFDPKTNLRSLFRLLLYLRFNTVLRATST